MRDWDPALLHSMLEDARRELADTKVLLAAARAGEVRWEHEAKALRKELNRVRQDRDTEVLPKQR